MSSSAAKATVDALLRRVDAAGALKRNIVAFSGGVDSSLVAALVQEVHPRTSVACIGRSAALPTAQLELARQVATQIGIELQEVATEEGKNPEYVANDGMACFHCKTELYSTLEAVARFAGEDVLRQRHTRASGAAAAFAVHGQRQGQQQQQQQQQFESSSSSSSSGGDEVETTEGEEKKDVVMFNGTNKEDRLDPTRVGLQAAANFGVASPIDGLTKDEVRAAARLLGLPNWRHAASPCLRSRLALGVAATDEALRRVELAEERVRSDLLVDAATGRGLLDVHHNLRVRMLAQGKAVVEVDAEMLEAAALRHAAFQEALVRDLGFQSVEIRAFRSGAVSTPVVI